MKKALFILHEYYPNVSAITNCVQPLIQKLIDQDISIDVITRRSTFDLMPIDVINNVNIYRIDDNLGLLNEKYLKSKTIYKKLYYRICRKLAWLNYNLFKSNQYGLLDRKRAVNLGKKIFKKNNYDLIVSCSYPFTTHEIAKQLIKRKSNCVWAAYQFDPHTYNYTFDSKKIHKRLKQEIKILSDADLIFISLEHYRYNINTPLSILKNKYCVLEFALIKENKEVSNNKEKEINNKITLVYAGTLYEGIREPFKMLEYLNQSKLNFSFNLYYNADIDIQKKLNSFISKQSWKLNLYLKKSKQECDNAIYDADIIVNIGNNISNQLPSKIYEAISTGKPIINFYTIDDDSSKEILDRYPLCLNIKLPSNDINIFDNFCLKNKNINISFEEIKKIYRSAEEVASNFLDEVEKAYETKQNKK